MTIFITHRKDLPRSSVYLFDGVSSVRLELYQLLEILTFQDQQQMGYSLN